MPRKNKRNKKPGPTAGKRKRDIDIRQDNTDDAGFPIARSDFTSKCARQLDTVNGPPQHRSVVDRTVLREITNFCEDQGLPIKKKQINEWCGVPDRTARRWRAEEGVSKKVATGQLERDPRADNASVIDNEQAIKMREFLAKGTKEQCSQSWSHIFTESTGNPPPSERTIRRAAHKVGVYDQITVRKTELDPRVVEMRKRTSRYIIEHLEDDIIFRQLRCSDESHEGVIKWEHDHQKRPLGFRDDSKKIQRDPPRSKKQKVNKKGKQSASQLLLNYEPRGPVNGDEHLRELIDQPVHYWGCVGVGYKLDLFFYNKNSNGKMDNKTYEEIIKWYN